MKIRVIKNYVTKYNDPIILFEGDLVKLGEEEKQMKWHGWIRASSENNSGWIPKDIVDSKDGVTGIITAEYSAKKLSVNAGEVLTLIKELNGWLWVKNTVSGEEGWIPKENAEVI